MGKHQPFQVGDRVWIETVSLYRSGGKRSAYEYEIVESNKSSAYAVDVDNLHKENPVRKRIVQRTREIKSNFSFGYDYILWESKEAFEKNVERQEQARIMRAQAIEKVKKMKFDELKSFLNEKDTG